MEGRSAVLSKLNGSPNPRVLFIAEAPGRRGADRTRIPMSGDASGRVFHHLLAQCGISESEIFITNAALCNPRGASGANRPPKASEVRNCSGFLRRTIDLLDPRIVVTIGAAALKAVGGIEAHSLSLAYVGRPIHWYGRQLIALYHPSPQVLISRRSLVQQEEDWRTLAQHLTAEEVRPDR